MGGGTSKGTPFPEERMTGRVEGQGETSSLEEGMATPFLGEGMACRVEK